MILVEDATAAYVDGIAPNAREMLNSRYDDLKSGRVKPIDGEEFFESLRRREDALLKKLHADERRARICPSSARRAGYHRHLGIHCDR